MLGAELTVVALDAAGHMALDEAVLMGAGGGEVALRIYEWSARGCTFGYSQPFSAASSACAGRGWTEVSPVRRSTGGGIVFHDGDLTFSLVFPWDRTCAPETIYKNIHRGVHAALKSAGVTSSLWSPKVRPLGAAAACFSRAEPMDLVAEDGKKILGGALRKKGVTGLYQGSLRLEALRASREVAQDAVAEGVTREFGGVVRRDVPEDRLSAGRALEARYRSSDWNERR